MSVTGSDSNLIRQFAVLLNHDHVYLTVEFRDHFEDMGTYAASVAVLEKDDRLTMRAFK